MNKPTDSKPAVAVCAKDGCTKIVVNGQELCARHRRPRLTQKRVAIQTARELREAMREIFDSDDK